MMTSDVGREEADLAEIGFGAAARREAAALGLKFRLSCWLESTMACTAEWTSTRRVSVPRKRNAVHRRERMIPAVPSESRNLRPLRSTSTTAPMVVRKLMMVKRTYPQWACRSESPLWMRMLALYPMMELMPVAWLQARITQARMKGITYLRRRSDSLALEAEDCDFSAAAACSISPSSS